MPPFIWIWNKNHLTNAERKSSVFQQWPVRDFPASYCVENQYHEGGANSPYCLPPILPTDSDNHPSVMPVSDLEPGDKAKGTS